MQEEGAFQRLRQSAATGQKTGIEEGGAPPAVGRGRPPEAAVTEATSFPPPRKRMRIVLDPRTSALSPSPALPSPSPISSSSSSYFMSAPRAPVTSHLQSSPSQPPPNISSLSSHASPPIGSAAWSPLPSPSAGTAANTTRAEFHRPFAPAAAGGLSELSDAPAVFTPQSPYIAAGVLPSASAALLSSIPSASCPSASAAAPPMFSSSLFSSDFSSSSPTPIANQIRSSESSLPAPSSMPPLRPGHRPGLPPSSDLYVRPASYSSSSCSLSISSSSSGGLGSSASSERPEPVTTSCSPVDGHRDAEAQRAALTERYLSYLRSIKDNWSSCHAARLVTPALLAHIKERFLGLSTPLKRESSKSVLSDILHDGETDPNEWVKKLSRILLPFVATGRVDLRETDTETAFRIIHFLDEQRAQHPEEGQYRRKAGLEQQHLCDPSVELAAAEAAAAAAAAAKQNLCSPEQQLTQQLEVLPPGPLEMTLFSARLNFDDLLKGIVRRGTEQLQQAMVSQQQREAAAAAAAAQQQQQQQHSSPHLPLRKSSIVSGFR